MNTYLNSRDTIEKPKIPPTSDNDSWTLSTSFVKGPLLSRQVQAQAQALGASKVPVHPKLYLALPPRRREPSHDGLCNESSRRKLTRPLVEKQKHGATKKSSAVQSKNGIRKYWSLSHCPSISPCNRASNSRAAGETLRALGPSHVPRSTYWTEAIRGSFLYIKSSPSWRVYKRRSYWPQTTS